MPPPITNGLVGHYDAKELSLSDGDAVNTWPDLSTSSNDLSDSVGVPTFRENEFPSGPGVEFTGSETLLSGSDILSTDNSFTYFIVFATDSVADSEDDVILGAGGSGTGRYYHYSTTVFGDANNQSRIWATNTSETLIGNDIRGESHYQAVRRDRGGTDDTWILKEDGTQLDSIIEGQNTGSPLREVGGGSEDDRYLEGSVGEILFYDQALTDSEISQVETYLNDKWFVQATTLQPSGSDADAGSLEANIRLLGGTNSFYTDYPANVTPGRDVDNGAIELNVREYGTVNNFTTDSAFSVVGGKDIDNGLIELDIRQYGTINNFTTNAQIALSVNPGLDAEAASATLSRAGVLSAVGLDAESATTSLARASILSGFGADADISSATVARNRIVTGVGSDADSATVVTGNNFVLFPLGLDAESGSSTLSRARTLSVTRGADAESSSLSLSRLTEILLSAADADVGGTPAVNRNRSLVVNALDPDAGQMSLTRTRGIAVTSGKDADASEIAPFVGWLLTPTGKDADEAIRFVRRNRTLSTDSFDSESADAILGRNRQLGISSADVESSTFPIILTEYLVPLGSDAEASSNPLNRNRTLSGVGSDVDVFSTSLLRDRPLVLSGPSDADESRFSTIQTFYLDPTSKDAESALKALERNRELLLLNQDADSGDVEFVFKDVPVETVLNAEATLYFEREANAIIVEERSGEATIILLRDAKGELQVDHE